MIRFRRHTAQPERARFERCVIVHNPASTNAKRVRERVQELRAVLPACAFVELATAREGRAASQRLIAQHADLLGPGTLLCIGGGDGTVNMVAETLLLHPDLSAAARATPILPLWGGNANDLAHMLNGPPHRARLGRVFAAGRVVPVHPLECKLTEKNGRSHTRIAVCYASFGATAFAASSLDQPVHRHHPLHKLPGGRFILEFLAGFSALMDAPTFRIEEQGKLKLVYERTFANGSRFAKIDRLPIKLTDNMFVLHTLEDKRLMSALPRTVELLQKRLAEKFLRDRALFTTREPTKAQFDGEVLQIAPGTQVRVRLSQRPLFVLSTKLAD